jgi:hypothetical protein
MSRIALIAALLAANGLAGCDLFGESPEKVAAAREAEGRAIGSACRHAARALEDCYALNKRAEKASVFAGWRDMNDYMRENKMDPVTPQLGAPVGGRSEAKSDEKADGKSDGTTTEAKAGEPAAEGASTEKRPAKARAPKHSDS